MKLLIYGQHIKKENLPYIRELFNALEKYRVEPLIYAPYAGELAKSDLLNQNYNYISNYENLKEANPDLVITLGGDGTILKAITLVKDSRIPILGINLGRLGFLASVEKSRIKEAINELVNKKFHVEERALLDLNCNIPIFEDSPFALNDFTLHKRDTSSMIIIKTYINDELLNSYWADGIIVSTPTGSTGYSLSCGGPIIFPASGNFVITPVAPHNLNVRPVVISDSSKITFEIDGRSENFLCTLDSRYETITSSHRIELNKAKFKTRLAHLEGSNFMKTIRNKLMWGLDMRN